MPFDTALLEDYVFPSDASRAENEELDSACCLIEHLLDALDSEANTEVTQMSGVQRYTDSDHDKCPNPDCKHSELGWASGFDVSGDMVYQEVYCMKCGAQWSDAYKLQGFENLKLPESSD